MTGNVAIHDWNDALRLIQPI
ncbi:protein of unknown function [Pseudomonas mediterranea]